MFDFFGYLASMTVGCVIGFVLAALFAAGDD